MNNKQALELAILEYEKDLETDENNQWIKNVLKGLKEIKQDLDRLEKLEQFVDIYKNTNQRFTMFIQSKSSNLPNPTLEQELLRKEVLENE